MARLLYLPHVCGAPRIGQDVAQPSNPLIIAHLACEKLQGFPAMSDDRESAALADRLRRHVYRLASEIGDRNYNRYEQLNKAAEYVHYQFKQCGYAPARQEYSIEGRKYGNIIAEKCGARKADGIVVLGAHYDTCFNPGADDNASAVAGMLEAARALSAAELGKTLRFIAFVNEEPPFFKTECMGSWVYTRQARTKGEDIGGAVILESIGYYSDEPGSQRYPPLFKLFYPDRGNFIGVVGNLASRRLVKRVVAAFKKHSDFPIESVTTSGLIPGVDWSDHWSFWREGYQAVMVTDTALFRTPHYHRESDTYEKLDYESMAGVVKGLCGVMSELAG